MAELARHLLTLQTVSAMRLRLLKKLAERIDGVDLSAHRVGDVLDLPAREARLLLAEEWALPERRERPRDYLSAAGADTNPVSTAADEPGRRRYRRARHA